jgi:hypothetical protein
MIFSGCGSKGIVFVEVKLVAHDAPPFQNSGVEPSPVQDMFVAEKVRRLQKSPATPASCGISELPRVGTLATWIRVRPQLRAAEQIQDRRPFSGPGQQRTAPYDATLGCFGRSGRDTSDSQCTSLQVADAIFQPAVYTLSA